MNKRPQKVRTIEIKFGAAKGIYTVHPVAEVFPMLTGEKYAELKASIQEFGQQEPLVLDDNMFLDGRNRLNVLNELGREPRIAEFGDFGSDLPPGVWVMTRNLQRRHLTDDQHIAIIAKYQDLCREEKERQRLESASIEKGEPQASAVAEDSNSDGEGADQVREETAPELLQEPAEKNLPPRRGRKPGTRSKVMALASASRQSRYRAEQMVKVRAQSPELTVAVEEDRMSLKDAAAAVPAAKVPPQSVSKTLEDAERRRSSAVAEASNWLHAKVGKLPPDQQRRFWREIIGISNTALSIS